MASAKKELHCFRCGRQFQDKSNYNRHIERKTPCVHILGEEDLNRQKITPHQCRFCKRSFSTRANMTTHIRKTCKIAPRADNPEGMNLLYDHVVREQAIKYKTEIDAMKAHIEALRAKLGAGPVPLANEPNELDLDHPLMANTSSSSSSSSSSGKGRALTFTPTAMCPAAPPAVVSSSNVVATNGVNNGNASNSINGGAGSQKVMIDQSVKNVTINVFGKENVNKITKQQIFDILTSAGHLDADRNNVRAVCERAILKAAMLVFSDPTHPENITCYLPSKKDSNALVHGEAGWEVQPVSLIVSPMVERSLDILFKHQPSPGDADTPVNMTRWVDNECTQIMRHMRDHEGELTCLAPKELRGILIRNRDLLERVLTKLPVVGSP